jgi:hypothetical protein
VRYLVVPCDHVTNNRKPSKRSLQRQDALARSQIEPAADKSVGGDELSTIETTPRSSPMLGVQPLSPQRQRVMAPFLWTHELARGAFFVVQAFFLYAMMLAVM